MLVFKTKYDFVGIKIIPDPEGHLRLLSPTKGWAGGIKSSKPPWNTLARDKGGGDFIEEVLDVCGVRMPVLCPEAWLGSRQPCIHCCEWKIVHGG
ncbi:hypothetical protein AVEN_226759-1 [Araneus ventricosus]|uniref:Uncharacterized protein n=1 Tax=Araneus ventricosus TaxID=182803 RepID=A0A4Y2UEZ2_ARAVE|nr:hypothetical protein AVEN_226759-1 [Araneus ventricosus]